MVEESKEIIDNNKALKNAFIQILPSENQKLEALDPLVIYLFSKATNFIKIITH